jgi:hypothetical protein
MRQHQEDGSGEQGGRAETGERPWPVKMLTWLLFFQGIGLVLIGLVNVDLGDGLQRILIDSSFFASLPALGILALVAAIGFMRPRPGAWVMAMLVQGLTLLITLVFYFRYRSGSVFLYAVMVYAIIMVLYLNYAQVPIIFRGHPEVVPEVNDE